VKWFMDSSRSTGRQHAIKRHISVREEHKLFSSLKFDRRRSNHEAEWYGDRNRAGCGDWYGMIDESCYTRKNLPRLPAGLLTFLKLDFHENMRLLL
jgi:hypothetical protein